jgi:hypothetical protein
MNDDETKTSFSYALNADELLHEGNRYYMGLYQLTTTRVIQNITKSSAEIIPILYNLQTNQIESNQDIIDRIFRRSQVEGNERNINNCDVIPKLVDDMSYDFAEFISKEKSKRLESEQRQNESDRLRNEQQAIQYYASRINEIESKMEDCLSDLSSLPSSYTDERNKVSKRIQGFKLQLRNLNKERDERMAIINEYKQFSIDEKLISLNIITIL